MPEEMRITGSGVATGRPVRAAIAQATPVPFDRAATLQVVQEWAQRAAADNVEVLVFPEAFVGGYPKGSVFGAVVGDRTQAGREEFRRYADAALTVPGDDVARLAGIAEATAVHLVVGLVERTAALCIARCCSSRRPGSFLVSVAS